MAEISVFQYVFPGKAGSPITNAKFAQLIWPNAFKPPNVVPLAVLPPSGPKQNVYEVSLQTGASGTIRVSAPGHGSDDVAIDNFASLQVLI